MAFYFLDFVNSVLAMGSRSSITALSTNADEDAYKAQACINQAINDLSLSLRIKSREIPFTITTVAGQRTYAIPRSVIYPLIDLRQKDSGMIIRPLATEDFDFLVPNDTSSGNPEYNYLDEFAGVNNQPLSSGEYIWTASNSADDTGNKIVIQGYDNYETGYLTVENMTLNGTTPVQSENQYSKILSISKPITNGMVSFCNDDTSVTTVYLRLNPNEICARIPMIGLHPIPGSVMTIYGRGYMSTPALTSAYQSPAGFPENSENAIIANAFARFMETDPKQASISRVALWQLADKELQKLLMNSRNDNIPRMMKSGYWGLHYKTGIANPLNLESL